MLRFLNVLLVIFITSNHVFGFAEDRIINGSPVLKTDLIYWSVVRLIEKNDQGVWVPLCSGVVYSKNIILTAAHCFDGKVGSEIRVAYEAQPFSIEMQYYPSTRIDPLTVFKTAKILSYEVHPGYFAGKKDNDIAVLRTELNHPDGFRAFPLLSTEISKKIIHGKDYLYTISGYGLIAGNPPVESELLRKATVTGTVKDQLIYVDQKWGAGGCFGDSGGPAFIQIDSKVYLAGVTQGGVGSSPYCDQMGTWTYIPNVLTYIMAAVGRLGLK